MIKALKSVMAFGLLSISIEAAPMYHPLSFTPNIMADTVLFYGTNHILKRKSINIFHDTITTSYEYDSNDKYLYHHIITFTKNGIPLSLVGFDSTGNIFREEKSISLNPGLRYQSVSRSKSNGEYIYVTNYVQLVKLPIQGGIYLLDSNYWDIPRKQIIWSVDEMNEGYNFEWTENGIVNEYIVLSSDLRPIRTYKRYSDVITQNFFKYDYKNRLIESMFIDGTGNDFDTSYSYYEYKYVNSGSVTKSVNKLIINYRTQTDVDNYDLLGRFNKNIIKNQIKIRRKSAR